MSASPVVNVHDDHANLLSRFRLMVLNVKSSNLYLVMTHTITIFGNEEADETEQIEQIEQTEVSEVIDMFDEIEQTSEYVLIDKVTTKEVVGYWV